MTENFILIGTNQIKTGDLVYCTTDGIDVPMGKGEVGVVSGLARFSADHPREAMVNRRWHFVTTLVLIPTSEAAQ